VIYGGHADDFTLERTIVDKPLAVRKGVFGLVAAAVLTVVYIWSDPAAWEAAARMSPLLWVLFLGINALFFVLLILAWHRHNWARWAAAIWTILGVLAFLWSWVFVDAPSAYDRVVQVIIVAVQLWACYHLLSNSASSWFRASAA
jgi:hypothetical protein